MCTQELTLSEYYLDFLSFCLFYFIGDIDFDDRTLMQDSHLEDSLYKNPESSETFLNHNAHDEKDPHEASGVDEDDQLQGRILLFV